MTNPPEIPKDIIESYKKLSEAKQKRLEFMAAYPEYLLNGIDLIRKDFQENTRQIAEELSKSSSRTAWRIAIFSLFGGFLLGLVSALVVPWVFRITNIETGVSANTTKIVSPEPLSAEKAQTPRSE